MDERVREALVRTRTAAAAAGQTAEAAARYAGARTGRMMESAKLNLKIFQLRSQISELLQQAGALIYAIHHGKAGDTG